MTPEEQQKQQEEWSKVKVKEWSWQWWLVAALFIWWFNGGKAWYNREVRGGGGFSEPYAAYIDAGYQPGPGGRLYAPPAPVDSFGWAVDGSGWVGRPGNEGGL